MISAGVLHFCTSASQGNDRAFLGIVSLLIRYPVFSYRIAINNWFYFQKFDLVWSFSYIIIQY